MDFTREPIIETVISAKDWHKLVIRNSKGAGQEEYFVDAVEVVSFGNTCFLRSTERPKNFLVPITDYEIVEVRETRMVLKNVGTEQDLSTSKGAKARGAEAESGTLDEEKAPKRDKRRPHRKRREKAEPAKQAKKEKEKHLKMPAGGKGGDTEDETYVSSSSSGETLLPPPPTLISETISRYKGSSIPKKVPAPGLEDKADKEIPKLDWEEDDLFLKEEKEDKEKDVGLPPAKNPDDFLKSLYEEKDKDLEK